MHLLDQRVLGIVMLFLLGMLVIIKQIATGSILEKPRGSLRVWLVNVFNLLFLLIVNPLVAILLVTRQWEAADPTHLTIGIPWVLIGLEIAGLALVVAGYLLMAWALLRLRRNYQLGGSPPRATDEFVAVGPYRLIRHPMYTAALSISLGLAGLLQSVVLLALFGLYLGLIVGLIPVEEEGLCRAYGEQYIVYRRTVRRLRAYP